MVFPRALRFRVPAPGFVGALTRGFNWIAGAAHRTQPPISWAASGRVRSPEDEIIKPRVRARTNPGSGDHEPGDREPRTTPGTANPGSGDHEPGDTGYSPRPPVHSSRSAGSSLDSASSASRSRMPCTSLIRSGRLCALKERQRWIRSHSSGGADLLISPAGTSCSLNSFSFSWKPSADGTTDGGSRRVTSRYMVAPKL